MAQDLGAVAPVEEADAAEQAQGPADYIVYRVEGTPEAVVRAQGTFLVLRLDAVDNDLERLCARIFADLTTNRPLALAIFAAMGMTGGVFAGLTEQGMLYGGGKDAGLACRDSA